MLRLSRLRPCRCLPRYPLVDLLILELQESTPKPPCSLSTAAQQAANYLIPFFFSDYFFLSCFWCVCVCVCGVGAVFTVCAWLVYPFQESSCFLFFRMRLFEVLDFRKAFFPKKKTISSIHCVVLRFISPPLFLVIYSLSFFSLVWIIVTVSPFPFFLFNVLCN